MNDFRRLSWGLTRKSTEDIMDSDEVYCYPVTSTKDPLGASKEVWAASPVAFRASVQENPEQSELVDPGKPPKRVFHLYTRDRDAAKWHDRLVFNGVTALVQSAIDRKVPGGSQYLYTKIVAHFLSEG